MSTRRYRPTLAEIDLDAIRANVRRLRPDGVGLMAVVKADAYGHGAAPVSRAVLEAGAAWLAVALVEEGIALRGAGIDAPILVLSEFPAGAGRGALGARLTPTITSPEGVDALVRAGAGLGRGPATVHLKVDTGMHRVGVWPPEDAASLARGASDAGLTVEGVFTHLASADRDDELTDTQLSRLSAAVEAIRAVGCAPTLVHAANSAATRRTARAHLDLVRVGASLYGLDAGEGLAEDLEPAMTLRSAVSTVRRIPAGDAVSYGHRYRLSADATIATVPIGYGDGYPRAASPGAEALVGGRRVPVAGTVTMDHLMLDCGDAAVAPGDEVVLIGRQGSERIRAEEIAEHAGTIGYEIVTRISQRVPRSYRGER